MTVATNAKASITQRLLETAGLFIVSIKGSFPGREFLPRPAPSSYGRGSTWKVLFIDSFFIARHVDTDISSLPFSSREKSYRGRLSRASAHPRTRMYRTHAAGCRMDDLRM